MRYESFIGKRHLKSTRGTFLSTLTILAVLGVALGVTAFTAFVSVAGGFVDEFRERVLGVNAHVIIMKHGIFFSEYQELQEAMMEVDGVIATSPYILHEMLVTSPNSTSRPGALVKGVDFVSLRASTEIDAMLVDGSLEDLAYDGELIDVQTEDSELVGVVLGDVLAERLQAEVGETITLISPLRGLQAAGWRSNERIPTYSRFEVRAIVSTGFYDYDSRLVLVDFRAVQDLLGRGDDVTGIELRVEDAQDTARVVEAINAMLPAGRYRVLDWPEINRNLFASLKLQKIALTLVMTLFVIVSAFVILCVVTMIVMEKRRDIAVLRSMGATRRGITRIFMYEGLMIGVTGAALGLIGGIVVCETLKRINFALELEVYRIDTLPVTVNPIEFVMAAVIALFWCFLLTLYPAFKAASVSPVEALRYD